MTETTDQFPEFFELLNVLREGDITDEQFAKLDRWLAANGDLRQYYVDYMLICVELRKYQGVPDTNEFIGLQTDTFSGISLFGQTDEDELPSREELLTKAIEEDEKYRTEREIEEAKRKAEEERQQTKKKREDVKQAAEKAFAKFINDERRRQEKLAYKLYKARQRRMIFGIGCLAACLILVLAVWIPDKLTPPKLVAPPIVASITQLRNAQWAKPVTPVTVGASLTASEMTLTRGWAELTLLDGARVILEAPAHIELIDANKIYVRQGRLAASVPPEAFGFTVETSNSSIKDIGTEFGVHVTKTGECNIHVFQGEVVLYPGRNKAVRNRREVVKAGQAKSIDAEGNKVVEIITDSGAFQRYVPSAYELAVKESKPVYYGRVDPHKPNRFIDIMGANPISDKPQILNGIVTEPLPEEIGPGYAIRLDDSVDRAVFKNPIRFNDRMAKRGGYTYIMWIKPNKIQKQVILTTIGGAKGKIYRVVGMDEEGFFEHFGHSIESRGGFVRSDNRSLAGQWYHVAVLRITNSPFNRKIFVNGKPFNSAIKADDKLSGKDMIHKNLLIGTIGDFAKDSGYADFAGAVGEICIYNRSLSDKEIKKLYEAAITESQINK